MGEPRPKADFLQQLFRAFGRLFSEHRVLARERRDQDVFQDGALRQEMMRLENETDLAIAHRGQLDVVELVQLTAVEQHLPAVRAVERAHDVQQRALARTGRSDDRDRFAASDFQRDLAQYWNRTVARRRFVTLRHVDQSQQGR